LVWTASARTSRKVGVAWLVRPGGRFGVKAPRPPSRYRRRMRLTVSGLQPSSWAMPAIEWPPSDNRRMEQLRNTSAEPVRLRR